jgi:glycine cleavage system H lipoate-binding protein
MVIFLVAFTIFAVILAQVISRRFRRKTEISRVELGERRMILSPVVAAPDPGKVPWLPEDVYFHSGHAWMKFEGGNRIKVGLDDFTQQVMGDIDGIEIPPIGAKLSQGEVAWKVRHGKRKLSQLAPLGGTVVDVNENLLKDPTLANHSPYDDGWILKIQTKGLNKEMPELMDALQFKAHFDQCKAKLMSSFNSQTLGLAYGDGGEVIRGVAGKLDEKAWKTLVAQLFHSSLD